MNVLAVFQDYTTSAIVNLIVPLRFLHDQGLINLQTCLENEVSPEKLLKADILVVGRSVDPTFKPIYDLALQTHIPIIYDLDDNLFDVPATSVLHKYFNHPVKQKQLEWIIRHSDRVRVHSPVLQDVVNQYNPHTSLVWAAVDWSLVPQHLPPLRTEPLEIVYAASHEIGELVFWQILPDIQRLLDQYGNRIRLHCLGYNPSELGRHPQVIFEPYEPNYETFFSKFTHHGYAIGLAPMLLDHFYQCKTDLKYRDYAAAGAAGVYTDCPLYHSRVVQRETGILVSNTRGSWFTAISELIENPALIEKIRSNARLAAQKRHNINTVAQMWMDDLASVPSRPPLSIEQQQTAQQQQWWFNRPRKPDLPIVARLRKLYHSYTPFKLHIILSHLYHWLKKAAYNR